MKKKLLSVLLAMMVAVTMTPMFAFATEGTEEEATAEPETAAEAEMTPKANDEEPIELSMLNISLKKTAFTHIDDKGVLENDICWELKYDETKALHGVPAFNVSLDNANAGKRWITVTSQDSYYTGAVTLPVTIKPIVVKSLDNFIMSEYEYTYNGKAKKPKIRHMEFTDEDGYESAIPASQYSIKYAYKNNVKIGTGKVTATIQFKGNYKGTFKANETFTICPKPTKITKIIRGKRTLRIKWKKVKKNISGYYVLVEDVNGIRYPSHDKYVSKKKTSCTFKGLKRHREYNVSVLTYKKVKGKKYFQWQDRSKVVRTK